MLPAGLGGCNLLSFQEPAAQATLGCSFAAEPRTSCFRPVLRLLLFQRLPAAPIHPSADSIQGQG